MAVLELAAASWAVPLPQPPPSISLATTAGANLSVTVWSGSPSTCQWSFNGVPIAGATKTILAITSFDLTNASIYSVAVTNQFGSERRIDPFGELFGRRQPHARLLVTEKGYQLRHDLRAGIVAQGMKSESWRAVTKAATDCSPLSRAIPLAHRAIRS